MVNEKRLTPRIDTTHLLSYTGRDQTADTRAQGMGRTLNVSQDGILLETHVAIDRELDILIEMALEDDLVELKGRIVHSTRRADGKIESGIQFLESTAEEKRLLHQYILLFAQQQPNRDPQD